MKKKLRLRELENWPPAPGGAYDSYTRFPVGGEGRVDGIFPILGDTVTMRGDFKGHSHSYHYQAPSKEVADRVYEVVSRNLGKTVREIGDLEIEVG